MNRDSIHVTMTAQLRRAKVRQRLEALAARTGLPVAQLAGRALTIGLGQIEADLRLIFPAEPAPEQPTALEPAWRFVVGEVDVLRDAPSGEGATHAA